MNYQDGYSQRALEALSKGKYATMRSNDLAHSRYDSPLRQAKQEAKKNRKPPTVNGMKGDPRYKKQKVKEPTLDPGISLMQTDFGILPVPNEVVMPETDLSSVIQQANFSLPEYTSPKKKVPSIIPTYQEQKQEQKQSKKQEKALEDFVNTLPATVNNPLLTDQVGKEQPSLMSDMKALSLEDLSNSKAKQSSKRAVKPATRYKNEPVAQTAEESDLPEVSAFPRNKYYYDKDLEEYFDSRINHPDEPDWDAETQTETPHYQNLKKHIMAKYGWSEDEFDKKWADYYATETDRLRIAEVELNKKVAEDNKALGTFGYLGEWIPSMVEGAASMVGAAADVTGLGKLIDKSGFGADDLARGHSDYEGDIRKVLPSTQSREAMRTIITDDMNPVASAAWNIGTSLTERTAAAGIPILGTAALGTEAAARTALKNEERGIDPYRSAWQTLGTGILNGYMNKVGFNKMGEGSVLRGGLAEGLEEVAEEVGNVALDTFLNQNKSEIFTLHDYYVNQGMSDAKAWANVAKDKGIDLAQNFGSGFAFGAFMRGLGEIPSLGNKISNALANKAKDAKLEANARAAQARAEIQSEIAERLGKTKVPDVVANAQAQAERAQAEIERLNQQIPETPEAPTAEEAGAEQIQTKPEVVQTLQENLEDVNQRIENLENTKTAVVENGGDATNIDNELNRLNERKAEIQQGLEKQGVVSEEEQKTTFNGDKKYSDQPVVVTKQDIPQDYIEQAMGDNYDNAPESVKIGVELLKRGYNLMENGGNNDVLASDEWSTLQDAVAHHLAVDNIPAETMAEAYDIVKQQGGNVYEAVKLAAEMAGTRMSDAAYDNVDISKYQANAKPQAETQAAGKTSSIRPYVNPENDTFPKNLMPVQFEGEELENAKTEYKKNLDTIKALKDKITVISNAPGAKRKGVVTKKVQKEIDAINKQIKEIQDKNKPLYRGIHGKETPIKEILKETDPDAYNQIYDWQNGLFGRIGIAAKLAGEQGKDLATKARAAINKVVETGDAYDLEDAYNALKDLDKAAREVNERYVTSKNPEGYYYEDAFGDMPLQEGIVATGHALGLAAERAQRYANAETGIDNTPKLTEAVEEAPKTEMPQEVPQAETKVPEMEAPKTDSVEEQQEVPQETAAKVEAPAETETPAETPNSEPPKPPIVLEQKENGDVMETGTSKHIRAEDTPMKYDVADEVVDDFVKDPAMYKQLKNSDTKALSEAIYNSGDADVTINKKTYSGNAETKFRQLLSEKNPAALYLGKKIADDYSAQGNHKMAAQIYRDMAYSLKEAGQFSQASVIAMMKNDPLSALAYFEKQIDDLNKEGKAKYGKKWKDFELTDAERAMFDTIEQGDEKAIKNAYDEIGARIEKEYPSAWWEKVLEFRRVAMLLNTRTIMRNTFANPPTALMRYVADRIEGVGQKVAHLINPDFEVTQAVRGSNRETRKLATEVYKSDRVQKMLKDTPGRLSEVPKVGDYAKSKQIFKGGFVSNFINKMTGNGIEKLNEKLGAKNAKSVLELARNSAYSALEITDSPFVRENFISRLGSYMRAKGIKSVDEVSDEAVNVALEEALKATYKDDSWLVQAIRKVKGGVEDIGNGVLPGTRAGDFASQALIPYVQAPGNIGARIVDYSAVGGTKGMVNLIRGASKGDMKLVSKGIEEMSKGASGTVMAAIGMALYKSGLITGTYSTDPDQKEFEKEHGFREFAFKWTSPTDGKTKYDTFDWAQPWADTIMSGVLLAQAIENSDQYDSDILRHFGYEDTTLGHFLGASRAAAGKEVNYFFDATPLKNLGDLLEGGYGQDKDIAKNIKENMVDDFITGLLPAQGNALAKTLDPTQRITYDPSNEFSSFLNSLKARVPELTKTLPTKYGTWGQPLTYGNSKLEAGFSKMFYPGEHTSDNSDWVDNEINKIYEDAKKDSRVFPRTAPNSIDGVKLTAEEKSQHQKLMGEQSRALVENFLQSDIYNKMSPKDKADTLNSIYQLSSDVANHEIKGKELSQKAAGLYSQYKQGDVQGVLNSIIADNNPYGVSANEYNKALDEGTDLSELEGYKETLQETGLSNSAALQEKYKTEGAQALKTQADTAAFFKDKYGLYAKEVPEVWANAKKEYPDMTEDQFNTQYREIAGQTGDAYKIAQDDVTSYIAQHQSEFRLPNGDWDMDKINKLWNAFRLNNWKQVPYVNDSGMIGHH